MERKSRYISAALLLALFAIFLIFTLHNDDGYPKTMRVVVESGKVRSGAGTEFELTGHVLKDETVIVLGESMDTDNQIWYRIEPKSLPQGERSWLVADEYYIRSDLLGLD